MKEFVRWVVADAEREKRFLATLSLMEYIGCRKIIKSLSFRQVSLGVLQHISEEANHAFLIRKLIKQIWNEEVNWETEPWSIFAWNYFNNLEQEVSMLVKDQELCYPILSQIIEKRVLGFYPLLIELSSHSEVQKISKIILAQEKNHARFFAADFPDFESKEESQFTEFMGALRGNDVFSIAQEATQSI